MGRTLGRLLKIVACTAIGGPLLAILFMPMSIACGFATVRVSGRLVDADTGLPLTNAFVVCFPDRAWAGDPERVDRYRRLIEERALFAAENQDPRSRHRFASSTVGGAHLASDGTFSIVVGLGSSEAHSLIGLKVSWSDPSPKNCSVLRVELQGEPPVLLDLDPKGWRQPPAEGDAEGFWASYDLGTLRVNRGD
ncbi:MAG: hypothetical protein ACT4PV_02600 [Planctomycetaceae bacterium]